MNDAMGSSSTDVLDIHMSCRYLIEISPDAIFIHHNNRVILANDVCRRLFRFERNEDLLGLSPYELAPSDTHAFLKERYEQVIAKHQQLPLVSTTACRRDRSILPVEMLAIPMPRTDGTTAVLVALRDISERQKAAEERVRSENQVRTILDTAMDGIISIDKQQNIVLFNTAAEEIFGWQAHQVMGRPISVLIPKRFEPQHHQYVDQFGRGVIPKRRMGIQRTVMALRASGEEFPIEASISHTRIDGETIYTVILRDVTEAVRYRQQIEQQSQMLDQVSDAVSVVDPTGRITYWNQGAQRLFGWSANESIGQNVFELLYREDSKVQVEILREMRASRSWSGEVTKKTRSGKSITVDHRQTILRNESGNAIGFICIDIDLTKRKKMERLSNRSQRLESIGTLAGGIAHDLNNVLTPILMGAKLLAANRVTSNRQGLLDTMVASAQRGAGLIQQLLSFAGGIQGERHPVRIEQLINETRGLLEHTLPKSIQIETTISSDCPSVIGDATELAQILMNLCINARDAMPDGGTLRIEADSTRLNGNSVQLHPDAVGGLYLLIKVSDTGCGMTSEVLDRIFDPFFTTKEIGKGTGLGLATVQGIVKSHGGFIIVYSEPGRGSTFCVYLPADEKAGVASDQLRSGRVELGRGQTILLVDDESTILQMTTTALEGHGYQALTARDGTAAVDLFRERRDTIAAVLLDMMMPGLDGLQTLDQLLQIDPNVKVIACSGLRTTQRETDAVKHGAKAFLPKPYTDTQLLHTISQVIES